MDDYYLTREDFDSIMELGIGQSDQKQTMKAIPTAVKSDFTRTYTITQNITMIIHVKSLDSIRRYIQYPFLQM